MVMLLVPGRGLSTAPGITRSSANQGRNNDRDEMGPAHSSRCGVGLFLSICSRRVTFLRTHCDVSEEFLWGNPEELDRHAQDFCRSATARRIRPISAVAEVFGISRTDSPDFTAACGCPGDRSRTGRPNRRATSGRRLLIPGFRYDRYAC